MAGSAVSMNRAVKVFMDYAGVTLGEAVQAATANPSRLLERFETCCEVREGQPANLALFRVGEDRLEIEKTLLKGEVVYERLESSAAGQQG
jgi:N-acetylglucosamine-6-phosphate deacetylase